MNKNPKSFGRLLPAATAVTAVAALVAAAFGLHDKPAQATAQAAPQAVPASVATVHKTDVAAWSEFSGRLEAIDRVELRPRVAGTVKSVHFREGALVKAGDLLFTIDPASYAADVDRAQAQVAAAQAQALHAKSEQAR